MEILNSIDDLKIYRGEDYHINKYITIRQPTLNEICDYGEIKYFNMVRSFCSVGADLKWQLDDINVDYTKITDFELFSYILSKNFKKDDTSILFGDSIDFSQMEIKFNTQLKENVLVALKDNSPYLQIDRYVYSSIVNVIRKIHKFKRNDELPGNESTRQVLIEDAREEYEENKDKPQKPFLLPLISTMVNSNGFKHDEVTVFNMKINAFMDSVARISKIKNADLLLSSGYSGFGIDLKKINNNELNYFGELD